MKFLALLALTLAASGFASSASLLSETLIEAIWKRPAVFVGICLDETFAGACGLTSEERALLGAILDSLPTEQAGGGPRFSSETDRPDLFVLPGESVPRVAVTGSKVGSPVYFNRSRIVETDASGKPAQLTPFTAIALLVHELGHHQGVAEHHSLEILGAKARKGLEAAAMTLSFADHHQPGFFFFFLNAVPSLKASAPFPVFFYTDGDHFYDQTDYIAAQPFCGGTRPASGLEFTSVEADPIWGWLPDSKQSLVGIVARARAQCGTEQEKPHLVFSDRLEPMRGEASGPQWWKTVPGHFVKGGSVLFVQRSQGGEEPRIRVVKSGPGEIFNGGTWEVEARLEIDSLEPRWCEGVIDGPFPQDEKTRVQTVPTDHCELQRLADGTYRVRVRHEFLATTFPSTYTLSALALRFVGTDKPSLVMLGNMPSIQVRTLLPEPAPRVLEVVPEGRAVSPSRYEVPERTWFWMHATIESTSAPVAGVLIYRASSPQGIFYGPVVYFSPISLEPYARNTRVERVGDHKWRLSVEVQFPQETVVMRTADLVELVAINRSYGSLRYLFDQPVHLEIVPK